MYAGKERRQPGRRTTNQTPYGRRATDRGNTIRLVGLRAVHEWHAAHEAIQSYLAKYPEIYGKTHAVASTHEIDGREVNLWVYQTPKFTVVLNRDIYQAVP